MALYSTGFHRIPVGIGGHSKDLLYSEKRIQDEEKRIDRQLRQMSIRPLNKCLKSGIGALAHNGDFWYPVHLIELHNHQWSVQWWRSCIFHDSSSEIEPGTVTSVPETNIVDSLWADTIRHRNIQLGKWTLVHSTQNSDDPLEEFSLASYTDEIEHALAPHISLIEGLIKSPRDVDLQHVPAIQWLQSRKKDLQTSLIPFTGLTLPLDQARVANWIESHITKDQITWKSQLEDMLNSSGKAVDVDCECLCRLEGQMFEISARAEKAGNYQWRLDVGGSPDHWDPWARHTDVWNKGDRDGDDTELEHGPNYAIIKQPKIIEIIKERPKPRLKRRNTTKPTNTTF
ncbi:hypothetical protein BDZ97DRAFT_1764645 [Flammula alnicola]|nr:hypothetical protein BDZ97DRAFT_1764645 [Flammula alnicola]